MSGELDPRPCFKCGEPLTPPATLCSEGCAASMGVIKTKWGAAPEDPVAAWMESLGFKSKKVESAFAKPVTLWQHDENTPWFFTQAQAAFFYQAQQAARIDELGNVQLVYGHRVAVTFVNGQAMTVEERIAHLEAEQKGDSSHD